MTQQLLTLDEAAERLHVPVPTLRYWRHKGTGPASFRMGRRVFFTAAALDEFVRTQANAA